MSSYPISTPSLDTSADYPAAYGLPADEVFGYDPAGNREDPGDPNLYAYDANNRISASPGPLAYGFDADGNLTSKTGETFGYDFTNRLRSFGKLGTAATYFYDPFGRRIKKETVIGATAVTTFYLWDGDQLLAEYDGSDTRTVRYAYAGGFAPAQVAYKDGSGENVYDVHTDHLDTPRLLTDDAGTVVWREVHEALGKAHLDAGNTVTFNIRFPGQYFDVESGLHYNRFRTYDPGVGRYISADPIGQFGILDTALNTDGRNAEVDFEVSEPVPFDNHQREGLSIVEAMTPNLYTYALSNPVGYVDPYGDITLRQVSNFAAGFGDVVSFGLTSAINDATGASAVVDPCSGAYTAGKAAGWVHTAATAGLGVARAAGWTSRVAFHGPHHAFGSLGNLSHIQVNFWKIGSKGSGRAVRIPLPW